jgi:GNAT superfamily N-acetyltransferase
MAVAIVGGQVAGITVFRVIEKTFTGRELYCDDLVTDEKQRSTGVGHALIAYMEAIGRERHATCSRSIPARSASRRTSSTSARQMPITAFHFTSLEAEA